MYGRPMKLPTSCPKLPQAEGAVRGLRISVGNLKLPDFQSRKPETSGQERAATCNQPKPAHHLQSQPKDSLFERLGLP